MTIKQLSANSEVDFTRLYVDDIAGVDASSLNSSKKLLVAIHGWFPVPVDRSTEESWERYFYKRIVPRVSKTGDLRS